MKNSFIGIICGLLNGLFGSGGGIAAIPLLEHNDIEAKKAHATSVALIFFLSLISTGFYIAGGNIDFNTALAYIPAGLGGAVIGAVFLKKTPNLLLRRIFGIIIIISAIRMLMK